MKVFFILSINLLVLFKGAGLFAQTLPVGTPVIEETWRRWQMKGAKELDASFMVRPLYANPLLSYDTLIDPVTDSAAPERAPAFSFAKGKGRGRLLPVSLWQQFNTHHPYGWNDGAMIPAKGYQTQLSFGVYAKLGPLSVQLRPEIVYAANPAFATFSAQDDTVWKYYYTEVLNLIDAPEKFGKGSYARVFPGQSSIRLNLKKWSLGISTENLWWGPGIRNSLLMSNNAPGFPHFTLNTTSPLQTSIGSFEGQLIGGYLEKSGILPADTSRTFNGDKLYSAKPGGGRYLNGVVLTWQPKWVPGLYLGFSRASYLYQSDVEPSFSGYFPVIGHLFKGNGDEIAREDAIARDQLLAFYFRLLLPKEKAELYAELGRNDHSGDMRDFLLEPEHSRAYTIGFRKLFEAAKQSEIEFFAEVTNVQRSPTAQLRGSPTWYIHHLVRDGYTNHGQVIGAGIGPGASSQAIGLNHIKGINKTGVFFERVVHNNDFYYESSRPTGNFWSHWVDLSLNFNKTWQKDRFIYAADIGVTSSLNYQWQSNKDVTNLQARLFVSYLF